MSQDSATRRELGKFQDILSASSGMSFARALFFGGEARYILSHDGIFPSAVSACYSVFHLCSTLVLAYCVAPTDQAYESELRRFEKDWRTAREKAKAAEDSASIPDPAGSLTHKQIAKFAETHLPSIFSVLGGDAPVRGLPGTTGTLRDMREFVDYAPRIIKRGHQLLRYSECQYEPSRFRTLLEGHLSRLDELFIGALNWLADHSYKDGVDRFFGWHFFVNQFGDLANYHPPAVTSRALAIYSTQCARVGKNPGDFTPEGFYIDASEEEAERRRFRDLMQLLARSDG